MKYRVLFQTTVTQETFVEADTPEQAEAQVNSDLSDGALYDAKELEARISTYDVQEVD